jgi:phosphatidylserine synthase
VAAKRAKKRPVVITVLGWLYIVVGAVSTAAHFADFRTHKLVMNEFVGITVLGAAAIIAGVYMLKRQDWARWLALVWIAAHVVISAFHPLHEFIVHCVLLALFAYLLFRRESREYFTAA